MFESPGCDSQQLRRPNAVYNTRLFTAGAMAMWVAQKPTWERGSEGRVREGGRRLVKEEDLGFKTGRLVVRVQSVRECVKGGHYGIRDSVMFPS